MWTAGREALVHERVEMMRKTVRERIEKGIKPNRITEKEKCMNSFNRLLKRWCLSLCPSLSLSLSLCNECWPVNWNFWWHRIGVQHSADAESRSKQRGLFTLYEFEVNLKLFCGKNAEKEQLAIIPQLEINTKVSGKTSMERRVRVCNLLNAVAARS